MRAAAASLVTATLLGLGATHTKPEELPQVLSEPEEIEAALEAAPAHLRDDAGVFVLDTFGYRRARASVNGFNCLVEREIANAFAPKCFDAEGSATLLPVILYRTEQRRRGVQRAYTEREIEARYASHLFIAPRRVGVCYMLSSRNIVVVDRASGKVWRVGPSLAFYAPHLRGEDFGVTPDLAARFLIADEATASTVIVVPVASERRARTFYYSPEALSPLAHGHGEPGPHPFDVDARATRSHRSAMFANTLGARY
jgi:hypothetical protein